MKFLILAFFLALSVSVAFADEAREEETSKSKSKLPLESSIEERSKKLNSNDEAASNLEKIIQEKSQKIAYLQNNIALLQKWIPVAQEKWVVLKANTEPYIQLASSKSVEMYKTAKIVTAPHVNKFQEVTAPHVRKVKKISKPYIDQAADLSRPHVDKLAVLMQPYTKQAMVTCTSFVKSATTYHRQLQKTSEEQKKRIQKTERALKADEEELMRAQLEASAKLKQLHEVHGAWLPPWLAAQMARYMAVMPAQWNEHGKPVMDSFLQMATEKSKQAQKWAEPHLETAKTKWIPVVQEKWVVLKANTEPYIQLVSSKSVEMYKTAKIVTAPHVNKFQEVTAPHVQKVKKISKPYIDQAADLSRPHVEKLAVLMQPYTKQAVVTYTSFVKTATTYHRQAQANIGEYLNKHEFTKQLVTKELIWFMTSEEQKKRIQKTEGALKADEEELMRAQLEASAKLKQLHEVHGAWLPPWLATQMARYMAVMSAEWNDHGKPVMDSFLQMATEKSKQAQKWA